MTAEVMHVHFSIFLNLSPLMVFNNKYNVLQSICRSLNTVPKAANIYDLPSTARFDHQLYSPISLIINN